jgi:hypothetical protein
MTTGADHAHWIMPAHYKKPSTCSGYQVNVQASHFDKILPGRSGLPEKAFVFAASATTKILPACSIVGWILHRRKWQRSLASEDKQRSFSYGR